MASPLINFGPLSGLIGNWVNAPNTNGVNLIAVPDQKGGFTLLIAPYGEAFNVTPLTATTPNRGFSTILNIPTLAYNQTIMNISNPSAPTLMHSESGFWELMAPSTNDGFDIFRSATIPHGNAVLVMGNASSPTNGPPSFTKLPSALPFGDLPQSFGYTDPYSGPPILPNFEPVNPGEYLQAVLAAQEADGYQVLSTTTLSVSTSNKGGMENIPSVGDRTQSQSKVNTTEFNAIFWIETVQAPDQSTFTQLQYFQHILLTFPVKTGKPGQTINWPHINMNTLRFAD